MHHKQLHELAKFGAGLIAADFLVLLWVTNANLLPVDFFGRTITEDMLLPGLIFDIALFFILVHYGWNVGKIPALRERTYLLVAGIVFGVVALAHLMRIFAGADLTIGSWGVPVWLSWVGVVATTYLSYMSFSLGTRMKK